MKGRSYKIGGVSWSKWSSIFYTSITYLLTKFLSPLSLHRLFPRETFIDSPMSLCPINIKWLIMPFRNLEIRFPAFEMTFFHFTNAEINIKVAKMAEIARILWYHFRIRKSNTKFHFKVRKPYNKLRKTPFKRGLEWKCLTIWRKKRRGGLLF